MSTPKPYWQERSTFQYYAVLRKLIEGVTAERQLPCVVDVGSADTPVVTWGRFARRITVDPKPWPPMEGVERLQGYWPRVTLPCLPDLLICCQCIEHQKDDVVMRFTGALLDSGARHLIVSVPHCWPRGRERDHHQDPINREKFYRLMHGAHPKLERIVKDGNMNRLIAQFDLP